MMNALILAKKDARSYWNSWVGFFIAFFFFMIAGLFFYMLLVSYAKISMDASGGTYESIQGIGLTRFLYGSFFLNMGALLIFFVPLMSMRAFAEERKYQTLELFFTYIS